MSRTAIFILIIAFTIVVIASIFASNSPDGLEKVAETLGFSETAKGTPGLMQDYLIPNVKSGTLSKALAGVAGIILVFSLFLLAAYALKFFKKHNPNITP